MATMSERATLRYVGPTPVQLHPSSEADPSNAAPDDLVTMTQDAAAWLLTNVGESWTAAGAVPDGVLTGKALTAALKAAGLPTTGKVDEKRARLAEHEAADRLPDPAPADWQNPDPEADEVTATPDDVEETEA